MFTFLSNWKNYLLSMAIIGSLSYNGLLYYQTKSLGNTLQSCQNNAASMQAAINFANTLKMQQEMELRLTEQEAAKAQAESQKRKDDILSQNIQGGCEGANQFLLNYALAFHWDNNIP